MPALVVGQRFVSEAEPELGLGQLERIEGRSLLLRFPASDTLRRYASGSAPIRRVAFRKGDEIEDARGRRFRVEAVEEEHGLLFYRGDSLRVPETELSGSLVFSKPDERLLSGLWDRSRSFDLRRRALHHRHAFSRSEGRGFLGARIELIPHQLYIAREIASRAEPRALLADEVGLGKTIEAGLVLHRLLRTGRIARVLVLVPEPLVHQWFVEMYRRFHLSFTIADERFCREAEAEQGGNPFFQTQTAIASLEFVAHHPLRREQAKDADWQMLVVDEAHHLVWCGGAPAPEAELVEAIAARAPGVLLLTATPEQLGEESHFARLRLLDPARYSSYERYREERGRYRAVAAAAAKILEGRKLSGKERRELEGVVPQRAATLRRSLEAVDAGDESARRAVMELLVDQHGPGRVVFRNSRKVLDQFPDRKLRGWPLDWPPERAALVEGLTKEFLCDSSELPRSAGLDDASDPRPAWLAALLRDLAPEKVLVICRSKEKASWLQEALRRRTTLATALFHEDLSLLQRDRNAAWFAEPAGAAALLCSEIGSEGRNFQFAHHLVLFDLPPSPELLEQRIGRLYRIGQEKTVEIHHAYLPGSPQEAMFLWYHQGLDAFEKSCPGAPALEELAVRARELASEQARAPQPGSLVALVRETRRLREKIAKEMEEGRDRLLELSSFRPRQAEELIAEIRRWDQDRTLDRFVVEALDSLGVELEEPSPRTFVFRQGNQLLVDALPGLRSDEVGMTADRDRATHQGELDLLTWDHPMVAGVLEILLGGERGNASVALLHSPEPGMLLEAIFVVDTVAPPELFVSRFLPPTPLRVVVDHRFSDVTGEHPSPSFEAMLADGRKAFRYREAPFPGDRLPRMLERVRAWAEGELPGIVGSSLSEMNAALSRERERMASLAEVNDHVGPEEVARVDEEIRRLREAIARARVRLDALRLVWTGPEPRGF